jgi:hypothetical protein
MLPDSSVDCKMSISCALDLCPYWLVIVLDHVVSAERIHAEVVEAWLSPDDERLGRAQEEEFVACMKCIMASAIAMDAFYSAVKNHVKLPSSPVFLVRFKALFC